MIMGEGPIYWDIDRVYTTCVICGTGTESGSVPDHMQQVNGRCHESARPISDLLVEREWDYIV